MSNLASNSDMKARLKFLQEISLIQSELFRPGIESEFTDEEQKKQFKKFRLKWSMFVQTVEIDIATVLVNKLEENQSGFEAGIQAINVEIQEINNTVGFLNVLERGLNILGRIVTI